MERRIWIVTAGTIALALCVEAVNAQGTHPCLGVPPDRFAVEFFREIESAPLSAYTYDSKFATQFKNGTSYDTLRGFLSSTHKRFGIDAYDKPIELRLTRPPIVERLPSKGADLGFLVSLSSYTSRGRTRQRVEMICEKDSWKAVRFTYEPEKD
jgi:hypothetical protein